MGGIGCAVGSGDKERSIRTSGAKPDGANVCIALMMVKRKLSAAMRMVK